MNACFIEKGDKREIVKDLSILGIVLFLLHLWYPSFELSFELCQRTFGFLLHCNI